MTDKRFDRQHRFAPLGQAGQAKLAESRVLLVGCGALGGALAQSLTRSGVGTLVLVDRDVVEESNLPRQVLFDAAHASASTPKVIAASETLARIGGPTRIEAHAVHLGVDNLEDLAEDADLILDGTDNLATRYLLNDYCVEEGLPWIYGGVVGGGGLVLAVHPGKGPCLRCIFPEAPPAGSLPTCDSAGVLQPAVAAIAALQAGLALRILSGAEPAPARLLQVDVWEGELRSLCTDRDPECPCCVHGERRYLEGADAQPALRFCGRNAVQVKPRATGFDLDSLERSLGDIATGMRRAGDILRFEIEGHRMTLFPDGRALVEGTEDIERALTLYDRYLGG